VLYIFGKRKQNSTPGQECAENERKISVLGKIKQNSTPGPEFAVMLCE
jgi:hypothetical protein